jgi:hypothetical protein
MENYYHAKPHAENQSGNSNFRVKVTYEKEF